MICWVGNEYFPSIHEVPHLIPQLCTNQLWKCMPAIKAFWGVEAGVSEAQSYPQLYIEFYESSLGHLR